MAPSAGCLMEAFMMWSKNHFYQWINAGNGWLFAVSTFCYLSHPKSVSFQGVHVEHWPNQSCCNGQKNFKTSFVPSDFPSSLIGNLVCMFDHFVKTMLPSTPIFNLARHCFNIFTYRSQDGHCPSVGNWQCASIFVFTFFTPTPSGQPCSLWL